MGDPHTAGIDPAQRRDAAPNWTQFLRSRARALIAADFVVIDLLDGTKIYVLAVIEHASRRARVLGATAHPVGDWVVQQARNLLMDLEDTGVRARFLIHDRDASFCVIFDHILADAGIAVIRSAVQALRMNAFIERWFRSLRAELTDRTPIWNIPHLRRLLREYESFYNEQCPHRAPGQAAPLRPVPENVIDLETFRVRRRDRAGGLPHEDAPVHHRARHAFPRQERPKIGEIGQTFNTPVASGSSPNTAMIHQSPPAKAPLTMSSRPATVRMTRPGPVDM